MKIMALGKSLSGKLLFPTLSQDEFSRRVAASLGGIRDASAHPPLLGPRAFQRKSLDVGDPRQAGWTWLVAADDPRKDDYLAIIEPLARLRGMLEPEKPIVFAGEADWADWLQDEYFGLTLDGKQVPLYVLFIGGPRHLPFGLQAMLDSIAHVGRLDFETLDELKSYVDKVIRLERCPVPLNPEILFFGTDHGPEDPTHYSAKWMVKPLATHVVDRHGWTATELTAGNATKHRLKSALEKSRPAILYTASHGLGMEGGPAIDRQRLNGAICCDVDGPLTRDELFAADDVPSTPFLEGGVFFQFACFGYGTPATSDYNHWFSPVAASNPVDPFVAALPKRLLAHPHGPVAFIGHVDTAFLHAFDNSAEQDEGVRWGTRMSPFVHAIDQLIGAQPSSLAMQQMNDRYNIANGYLTRVYETQQKDKTGSLPELGQRLTDNWIFRSDAQNYMVLGDPAARLRV